MKPERLNVPVLFISEAVMENTHLALLYNILQ